MITFFRKIRQYLLAENRIGKYLLYALGEIVLVVIGILIALQINNWNELRKEANEEQKILHVLQSEFVYNQQELDRNILKAHRLKSRADSLLTLIDSSGEQTDSGLISHLMRSLSAYTTFDPSNGALFTLINSGKLDIIKNDSLRLHLSKWIGEVQDVKEDEARLMVFGDTYMDPLRLEYLHFNPDSKFPANPEALMSNLRFENIVARISFGADYNLENYAVLEGDIQRILMLISKALKVKE